MSNLRVISFLSDDALLEKLRGSLWHRNRLLNRLDKLYHSGNISTEDQQVIRLTIRLLKQHLSSGAGPNTPGEQ